jgi:hypothetical protein
VWQGVDGVGMLQGEWEAGGREGREGAWQEVVWVCWGVGASQGAGREKASRGMQQGVADGWPPAKTGCRWVQGGMAGVVAAASSRQEHPQSQLVPAGCALPATPFPSAPIKPHARLPPTPSTQPAPADLTLCFLVCAQLHVCPDGPGPPGPGPQLAARPAGPAGLLRRPHPPGRQRQQAAPDQRVAGGAGGVQEAAHAAAGAQPAAGGVLADGGGGGEVLQTVADRAGKVNKAQMWWAQGGACVSRCAVLCVPARHCSTPKKSFAIQSTMYLLDCPVHPLPPLTTPCVSSSPPHHTTPHNTTPRPHHTTPHHTTPHHTTPHHTTPHHTTPHHTPPHPTPPHTHIPANSLPIPHRRSRMRWAR